MGRGAAGDRNMVAYFTSFLNILKKPRECMLYNMLMFKRLTRGQEDAVDLIFILSVLGKGVGGGLQLVAGGLLIFLSTEQLYSLIKPLSGLSSELGQTVTSQQKWFGVAYFLSHGIIRVGLAVALLREKIWAYPLAILVLAGFVAYQTVALYNHPSLYLLGLTLFDLLIIGLTRYEYLKLKRGGHLHLPGM